MSAETLAAFSLRLVREEGVELPKELIDNPRIARHVMQTYLQDRDREHLAVIIVDGQNRMLGISTVAIGGAAGLASALGIILMDHIIVSSGSIPGTMSFLEKDLLQHD